MSNMYGKTINLLKGYVKIGDKQYEICSAEPSEELGEHIKAIVNDLVVNNIIDVIDTKELTEILLQELGDLQSSLEKNIDEEQARATEAEFQIASDLIMTKTSLELQNSLLNMKIDQIPILEAINDNGRIILQEKTKMEEN